MPNQVLVVNPSNQMSYVGESSVNITCTSSLSSGVLNWWLGSVSPYTRLCCYNLDILSDLKAKYEHYSLTNGTYVLAIRNVQLSDAGRYTCTVTVSRSEHYDAISYLTVQGTKKFKL